MVKEVSIFIDNKPGRLKAVTAILKEKNINIRALTVQDREEYGLMRLIVDKPEEAYMEIQGKRFCLCFERYTRHKNR